MPKYHIFYCLNYSIIISCGLVALKLAGDILKRPQSNCTNKIEDLLKVAQDNGFTYHGEMFSARDMGLLAKKYYELTFDVINSGLDDYVQILDHLCRGYPVLIPYDADRNHEPCLKKGNKAHWAVITGMWSTLKIYNSGKRSKSYSSLEFSPFS